MAAGGSPPTELEPHYTRWLLEELRALRAGSTGEMEALEETIGRVTSRALEDISGLLELATGEAVVIREHLRLIKDAVPDHVRKTAVYIRAQTILIGMEGKTARQKVFAIQNSRMTEEVRNAVSEQFITKCIIDRGSFEQAYSAYQIHTTPRPTTLCEELIDALCQCKPEGWYDKADDILDSNFTDDGDIFRLRAAIDAARDSSSNEERLG